MMREDPYRACYNGESNKLTFKLLILTKRKNDRSPDLYRKDNMLFSMCALILILNAI